MTDDLKPHPEDFCEECGLTNVIWSAPNKLWNKIARRPDGTDPMLCPTCFIKLVEKDAATGVQNAIDAALESVATDLLGIAASMQKINPESTVSYRPEVAAYRKAASLLRSRIGTNPLAERDAMIAELESLLAEAYADADDVLQPADRRA